MIGEKWRSERETVSNGRIEAEGGEVRGHVDPLARRQWAIDPWQSFGCYVPFFSSLFNSKSFKNERLLWNVMLCRADNIIHIGTSKIRI